MGLEPNLILLNFNFMSQISPKSFKLLQPTGSTRREIINTQSTHDRLSYARNRALEPLTREFEWVVFLNDIAWGWTGLAQLMDNTDVDFDMVCGFDYSGRYAAGVCAGCALVATCCEG